MCGEALGTPSIPVPPAAIAFATIPATSPGPWCLWCAAPRIFSYVVCPLETCIHCTLINIETQIHWNAVQRVKYAVSGSCNNGAHNTGAKKRHCVAGSIGLGFVDVGIGLSGRGRLGK